MSFATPGRYLPTEGIFILEGADQYAPQIIFQSNMGVPAPNMPNAGDQYAPQIIFQSNIVPTPGVLPISGDWNRLGYDQVGLYVPATGFFYLGTENSPAVQWRLVQYGPVNAPGWLPCPGDFDGDGRATVGLYNAANGRWYLRNSNTSGPADIGGPNGFQYGPPGLGWLPIMGDWNGDGKDTVGAFDPGSAHFFLKNSNSAGNADIDFAFGTPRAKQTPVAGCWFGPSDSVGLYHPWAVDVNSYFPFILRINSIDTWKWNTALRSGRALPFAGRWTK